MGLEATIRADLKTAMKAREPERVSVLRMLLADLENRRIDKGSDLTDEEVVAVVRTARKRRLDSIEQFEKGGRDEMAAKERSELEVLQPFLPAQLGEEEIEAQAAAVIEELGASTRKDMGRVMQELMRRLAGRADGKIVSRIVGTKLG